MSERYEAPWRKQMQPASFRGVGFKVKKADTQVGRRVVVHEYPQRDNAWPEDMGLKDNAFTIEAIVIGPDYIKARDALIEVLRQPGAGTLIHPYYGKRTVTLASPARISESSDHGGSARFSLDFIEAGENAEPSAREDTQSDVDQVADEANATMGKDFEQTYSIAKTPDFVGQGALDMANDMARKINALRTRLVPSLSMLSPYMQAAQSLFGNVAALIRAPAAYAQGVLGMIGALKALALQPKHALNSYKALFDYGNKVPKLRGTTPMRQRQLANQQAMTALVRRGALIEASRTASQATWATSAEALAARDDLAARLDDEAAGIVPAPGGGTQVVPPSEEVFQALTALRIALVRDLTRRAVDAPALATATLPSTMPALVAAYRIHGDATREAEIVERNGVRNPAFVPGAVPLEVLAVNSKAL